MISENGEACERMKTYSEAGRDVTWCAAQNRVRCDWTLTCWTQETDVDGWVTLTHNGWRGYTDCWPDQRWYTPQHARHYSLDTHTHTRTQTHTHHTGYMTVTNTQTTDDPHLWVLHTSDNKYMSANFGTDQFCHQLIDQATIRLIN